MLPVDAKKCKICGSRKTNLVLFFLLKTAELRKTIDFLL